MYSTLKKMMAVIIVAVFLLSYLPVVKTESATNAGNFDYYVGAGMYDITGPAAEVVMMGYADSAHKTEGLHFRLRSRAFIMKEKDANNNVVFVSADVGTIFHSVTQGVINKLEQNGYGHLYNYSNVILSATHSHSGPGGYSHEGLYNVSTFGFHEENYQAIVDGIYESIIRAHHNLEPGYIEITEGYLDGTSANRSIEAYNNNPEGERNKFQDSVDKTVTHLNFRNQQGELLGIINWFAVHPVSMSQENHLISGDNKGYASYLYEKEMGTDYTDNKTFVAAFAQANEGDVTPNIFGDGKGYGDDDFDSTKRSGEIQFEKAKALSNLAEIRLTGPISSRHEFVDFSNLVVDPQYTDGEERRTYPSTMGYSFAAGTEDGRTNLPVFVEGMTQSEYSIDGYDNLVTYAQGLLTLVPQIGEMSGVLYPELWEQHYPKPILFAPSEVSPDPWTPQIIPLQMVQIGQLSILAVPAEFTSMAGRRLKESVNEKMGPQFNGENYVVVAGLSNSYSSYVTTPEEYDVQHYEGASTQFGKWTLSGYLQEFDKLSNAIINNEGIAPGPLPKDLSNEQVYFDIGIVFDAPPIFKDFGDVKDDVQLSYQKGDIVSVSFWSGHPNNNFRTQSTYLEVQKLENGEWITVANDGDWETKYRWIRESTILGTSSSLIEWEIPFDADAGNYRIVHYGAYQTITGKVYEYDGISSEFTLE
ncbi:neutral/alkaline ceramidase [Cytobacillus sp. IB215665]|uniref:neutral/alkaline ceramidase n=1 Tax=Cytobacillus sp. IB215665 TaxID=3097357 RepID=UPI002A0BC13E|nr:neutral/alkaline non-lysosomal ceramidase N-terminal domain-containing protein [Cytobacillus sp. IB215665]MDX8364321.1 neutral/alkaline non-lysosomal ceramidase N-terminal domain-containing protein [Cytobacillus sp. IB215665]